MIIAICFFLPSLLHAQPNFTDDVTDAPIDGGLSVLIAGGIGYGIKKVKDARIKRKV
jgi:hypothetical protein